MRHLLIGLILTGLGLAGAPSVAQAQGHGPCPGPFSPFCPDAYCPGPGPAYCPGPGSYYPDCPGPFSPGPGYHPPGFGHDPCCDLGQGYPLPPKQFGGVPQTPGGGCCPDHPNGKSYPLAFPGKPGYTQPNITYPPGQAPYSPSQAPYPNPAKTYPNPGKTYPPAYPGQGNPAPPDSESDSVPPPPGPVPPSQGVTPSNPGQGFTPPPNGKPGGPGYFPPQGVPGPY
jgi:hypothetical protein